jgi:hypothetical protein
MLIGYVSDAQYVALADVAVEFTNERGESLEVRSRASGSIHGDLPRPASMSSRTPSRATAASACA